MLPDVTDKLEPGKLAPLFAVLASFHGLALITRFDVVAAEVPSSVAAAILLAHFPLLLVAGYFEARLDYGESAVRLPLWMRIKSKPVKLAFTLAMTYLGVVVLQAWDISIGPVDPSPPPEWALGQRAMWFAIMSVGMFFPNYLLTCSVLIPALRAIAKPLHRLPPAAALAILSVVGLGIGSVAVIGLASQTLQGGIGAIQGAAAKSPAAAIGIALGIVLFPITWGLVSARSKSD